MTNEMMKAVYTFKTSTGLLILMALVVAICCIPAVIAHTSNYSHQVLNGMKHSVAQKAADHQVRHNRA